MPALVAAEVSLTRPFVVSSWEPTGICVALVSGTNLPPGTFRRTCPETTLTFTALPATGGGGAVGVAVPKFQTTPSPVLSPGARLARSHCTATPLSTRFGLIVSARFGGVARLLLTMFWIVEFASS